ncbi:MAG: GFA family protein [Steroidobacteraceae bacterium]
MTHHHAACDCGQLRVTCEGDAVRISMCHCIACQRRTGAPFSANSRFERKRVTVAGRSTVYTRKADSGNSVSFHFCPVCGSTVYWELSGFPTLIAVAQGMFADPEYPPPTVSVWEQTRHPWTDRISLIHRWSTSLVLRDGSASQDPEFLRRLLRAKDRMDAASHEHWPVRRLARVSRVSEAHFARSR